MVSPGSGLYRFPWALAVVGLLLVAIGWVGAARCGELAGQSGDVLARQIAWSVVAGLAAAMAATVSYRKVGRASYGLFLAVVVALVAAYFFPPVNGARRWIRWGGIGFQPSEFAKVAYVLALAWYLRYRDNHRRLAGLLFPLALTMVPVLLILREPDLGTAAVFIPVFFVMLFAAGARRIDLVWLVAAGLLALPALWSQMSREQRSRVGALFDQAGPGEVATGDAYHLRQAKQMCALGGWWGSALRGSPIDDPVVYHLPEARSDFIFCVLVERFGLWGAGVLLGLYAALVWQGLAVARATGEPFGRLMAVGLAALFAIEVLINTGMTVGLLPITGLSLPLVSHGGSGLVAHAIALGLLINVALRPGYEVAGEPFRYVATGKSRPSRHRARL